MKLAEHQAREGAPMNPSSRYWEESRNQIEEGKEWEGRGVSGGG